MVDTTIWMNALQDIKNRLKSDKNRISEISVEIRIREEEIGRSRSSVDTETLSLKNMEIELERAKTQG